MKNVLSFLVLLVILVLLSSCSSHAGAPRTGTGKITVGSVEVDIDSQTLTGERKSVFEKLNGANQIKSFTRLKLEEQGLYNASSTNRLKITVSGFKLRSGATAALAGLFAGQDSVTARVSVGTPGNELHSFVVDEGSFGSIGSISRDSRSEDLFRNVAEIIVDGLQ